MAKYYPRKQTIFIFILSAATVAAVAYYAAPQKSAVTAIRTENIDVAPSPQNSGTDTTYKNTDWKQEFIDSTTKKSSVAAVGKAEDANLTLTERLGRTFFTQYVQLEQSNLGNDPTALSKAATNLVSDSIGAESAERFNVDDITIASLDDQNMLNSWNAGLLRILGEYNAQDSEAIIANQYLNTNDPTILKRIDPIIVTYKSMLTQLLALPTPRSAENEMLDLVNALSSLKFAAVSLRQMDTDPMLGMLGVKAFGDGAMGIDSAFVAIRSRLNSHGLVFNVNPQVIRTVFEDQ